MIWFGNLSRILVGPTAEAIANSAESTRMQVALERTAERSPGLSGQDLVDALVATGWVNRRTAERLLPHFRHFDPDRHFSEYLRRLSFRGSSAAEPFRAGVRCLVEETLGDGWIDRVGPEPCIRFGLGEFEGVVLAQPQVGFTISGQTRDALAAAVEEMPDVVVVVARTFDRHAVQQLGGILHRSGLPGTLVTVNLLLGIRAMTLRYQPDPRRVAELLACGGTLRSADIASLGEREAAVA
ncbi:MAG: hypothetical protein WD737_07480 [Gemmatimonadota bacterium]